MKNRLSMRVVESGDERPLRNIVQEDAVSCTLIITDAEHNGSKQSTRNNMALLLGHHI